ncbi:nucleoside 2-deoxyribosyltransferase [candidate division KSB1 bacterium]|nr:nucleoside 2-deoxyribosyltransferase [candidate division KSB1 bacterium]
MTIYFCGAIAGGRTFLSTYTKIVRYVQHLGHTVPTEHIIEPNVLDYELQLTAEEIYQRDIDWLTDSHLVIAEISNPSLGVGYEICYALHSGKKVLALHQHGLFVSRMITGNPDPNLTVRDYQTENDWKAIIETFLRTNHAL